MKTSHKRITVFFIIAYILLFATGYFFSDFKNTYLQVFGPLSVIMFGAYTYLFQLELIRFNRIAHRPSLIVNRASLENEKVVKIENKEDRIAYDVYIASLLYTQSDNNFLCLYDEIIQFIAADYPVVQSDILKEDFRSEFVREDVIKYGDTLKKRLECFCNKHIKQELYLVIALRSPLINADETPLFFYKSKEYSDLNSLAFKSIHLSRSSHIFKKALSSADERYRMELKRT